MLIFFSILFLIFFLFKFFAQQTKAAICRYFVFWVSRSFSAFIFYFWLSIHFLLLFPIRERHLAEDDQNRRIPVLIMTHFFEKFPIFQNFCSTNFRNLFFIEILRYFLFFIEILRNFLFLLEILRNFLFLEFFSTNFRIFFFGNF